MEKAATHHLKKIGAWLKPVRASVDLNEGQFPVTASIIIPVRDRGNTIGDAVASALRQQTSFPFNASWSTIIQRTKRQTYSGRCDARLATRAPHSFKDGPGNRRMLE